ncbi:hypothetical protein GCM10010400_08340 [Streptomyces aculeolatus]
MRSGAIVADRGQADHAGGGDAGPPGGLQRAAQAVYVGEIAAATIGTGTLTSPNVVIPDQAVRAIRLTSAPCPFSCLGRPDALRAGAPGTGPRTAGTACATPHGR